MEELDAVEAIDKLLAGNIDLLKGESIKSKKRSSTDGLVICWSCYPKAMCR